MSIDLQHPTVIKLRKTIREDPRKFIPLVGSGLSRPANIPSWVGLREILASDALSRKSDLPSDEQDTYVKQIERIKTDTDYWRSFQELKRILHSPAYESCIKDALSVKTAKLPENYELLWKLDVAGIITLNLDLCSIDSYASLHHRTVDFATAKQASKYCYFLSSGNKFVFQPHGIVNETDSWVFTKTELQEIVKQPDYISFINSVFNTRSILFLGLNAEDISIQYLILQTLNIQGRLGSQHFAVLANPSPEIIREYSDRNIEIISYIPDSDEHYEITLLLKHLLEFKPKDEIYGSVYKTNDEFEDKSPEELANLSIEEIRQVLNSKVSRIIDPDKTPSLSDLEALEKFYKEYVLPIHKAWLVQPGTQYDNLFGYKVSKRVGKGAFGQVFEAEDPLNSDRAAIKLLLPELRDHLHFINSFRRGVRSMKILSERNIDGVVKIKSAFEIPACIFMEFIDGPTLREAVNHGYLSELANCLYVLSRIGEIVKHGHELEEIVLHRDLKPDNIILRDYYGKGFDLKVVVLDFDLSWHKGALDLSIVDGARAQGYAAPETTASYPKGLGNIRSTAVDVFGLGMVAFYTFVGTDPRPNEHKFDDYKDNIKNAIERRFRPDFTSIPEYLSDVIVKCTYDIQPERISFSSAVESIIDLYKIVLSNKVPAGHPLILLEIVNKISKNGKFTIEDFGRKVKALYLDRSKPMEVSFVDKAYDKFIRVNIGKIRTETDDRNVVKYLETAKLRAESALREGNFLEISSNIQQSALEVSALYKIKEDVTLKEIEKVSETIIKARTSLELR